MIQYQTLKIIIKLDTIIYKPKVIMSEKISMTKIILSPFIRLRQHTYILFLIFLFIITFIDYRILKININQTFLNSSINNNLPILIKKQIKSPLSKDVETILITIKENNIWFEKNKLNTKSKGIVTYKNDIINFTIMSYGDKFYYENKQSVFFFTPSQIKVSLSQVDIDKFLPSTKIANPRKKDLKSKNPLKRLRAKIYRKYNKIVNNVFNRKIRKKIQYILEKEIIQKLSLDPLFKFKNNEQHNYLKKTISNIEIINNEIVIELKTTPLLIKYSHIGLILLSLFILFETIYILFYFKRRRKRKIA